MDINQINDPTVGDFSPSIKLLNNVFSKFPGYSVYNPLTAYKKTKGKDTVIFEASEDGRLVGFAIGYERYQDYYHIWELGVDEEFRAKGIATDLYNKIEKYAKNRGYKGITLNTFNRYKSNIRIIIKRGYEIYDLDKNGDYYNDPKIKLRKVFG